MPTFTFNSIDEVKEFVKSLKGTRGAKGDAEDGPATGQAPAPMMPPAGAPATGFAPQAAGFQPPAGAGGMPFGTSPAQAFNSGASPEVTAIITRIKTKLDAALASGQAADQALTWFRGQCGPEAAAATMEQIKDVFLPRLPMPSLENIAKLMAA